MRYSLTKGLIKTIINLAIFGLPLLITALPEYANLTIGGAIYMLVNYLKNRK